MIVQTDSVCSSEEERENYDNMKAEIQLTTSLIKNENTCYIWVFASTMLSRNPLPSHIRSLHNFLKRLYFISSLWVSRHKTHRFYIEKSWVLLSTLPNNYDLSSFHTPSYSWFSYLWNNGISLRIFSTNIPFSKRFSSQLACQFSKILITSLPQG